MIIKKDWTGDKNSIYKTLGASNHTKEARADSDYYATDPIAAKWLLHLEKFSDKIWEPACGSGELSKVFEEAGYKVKSTDIVYRGYGEGGIDFLSSSIVQWDGDIITNPPYKYALEFVLKALNIIPVGNKVAMFLKLTFLEGRKRREKLFDQYPPKYIYVSSSRLLCAKNANFEKYEKQGSAAAYAWFVWYKGYKNEPKIRWFNRIQAKSFHLL